MCPYVSKSCAHLSNKILRWHDVASPTNVWLGSEFDDYWFAAGRSEFKWTVIQRFFQPLRHSFYNEYSPFLDRRTKSLPICRCQRNNLIHQISGTGILQPSDLSVLQLNKVVTR
jgi:hypothetical protein